MPKPGDYDFRITCRGRNGWFNLEEVELVKLMVDEEIHIGIRSKRRGEMSPIMIYGPAILVKALIDRLARAVDSSNTQWDCIITRKEIEDAPNPGI